MLVAAQAFGKWCKHNLEDTKSNILALWCKCLFAARARNLVGVRGAAWVEQQECVLRIVLEMLVAAQVFGKWCKHNLEDEFLALSRKCVVANKYLVGLRVTAQVELSSTQAHGRIGLTNPSGRAGVELGRGKNVGKSNHDVFVVVVVEMEEYDAEALARSMSVSVIAKLVAGLDRAELVELMNLGIDWPIVADIKGIHPPSLTAPKTLRIHAEECPFLEAGTSSDCCEGSIICRSGHSTISMPCYRTDLLSDSSLCEHCQQLWATQDGDGFYVLDPETMDKAAQYYAPGMTGVMKKWQEMAGASTIFDKEVQSAKDVFADSTDQLDADFPGMDFQQFCKEILNDSGVLFSDAGRSRNPYRRTQVQQVRIGAYTQRMAVLWVRVKAAVPEAVFAKFVSELRGISSRVEQAARWTVQKAFSQYPVFVGPLVCADVMLAGFSYAEARYHHQVARVMQNTQEDRDTSNINVGPVIACLDKWARSVKPIKRASPSKRKTVVKAAAKAAPASTKTPLWDAAAAVEVTVAKNLHSAFQTPIPDAKHASSGEVSPPKSKKAPTFYGVGRGFVPGVYTSWEEANTQVKNFSGFRVKKFKSATEAERYVDEMQANPGKVWYVLKGSRKDGAYESKEMALSWKRIGSKLVERNSLSAAKRFLGKSRIQVYRNDEGALGPESAAAPSSQDSAASAEIQHKRQFFACKDSSEAGVYASLKEVLEAVKKGGGTFEAFATEAEAAEYCRPRTTANNDRTAEQVYIVWAGKATGVMSAADCINATAGVAGAEADGPMSRAEAEALWVGEKEPVKEVDSEAEELQHVEYSTDEAWAAAITSKQSRVFACWTSKGKGRIAFTWEEAAPGVQKNLSVEVFSAEDTIFMNFARAEEFLSKSKSVMSIKDQIAAARKSVSKSPKARRKTSAAPARATATASPKKHSITGQLVGVRVGRSGVVHTREASQIRRCFINASTAVEVRGAPDEPEDDDLDMNMPAPGEATYLRKDVDEHIDGAGDLTLFDYYAYKKGKVKAWPLQDYDKFLSFCRQGQKLCANSSTEVGVANAAMFHGLLDIAVRTHG